jgi:hypothetical protein
MADEEYRKPDPDAWKKPEKRRISREEDRKNESDCL